MREWALTQLRLASKLTSLRIPLPVGEGLALGKGKRLCRPPVVIGQYLTPDRRDGASAAGCTVAEAASHADRRRLGGLRVRALGIDQLRGVLGRAGERDGAIDARA